MRFCNKCNSKVRTVSRGMCHRCYMVWYYHTNPAYKQSMIEVNRARRISNPELRKIEYQKSLTKPGYAESERLRKGRLKDKVRFGGNKESVLQRDKYRCVFCQKITRTVHHKDGHGYTQTKYPVNNSIENLVTCCQSCHMSKLHTNIILNNLVNRPPWNKGLTLADPRVAKNLIGIHKYWKRA